MDELPEKEKSAWIKAISTNSTIEILHKPTLDICSLISRELRDCNDTSKRLCVFEDIIRCIIYSYHERSLRPPNVDESLLSFEAANEKNVYSVLLSIFCDIAAKRGRDSAESEKSGEFLALYMRRFLKGLPSHMMDVLLQTECAPKLASDSLIAFTFELISANLPSTFKHLDYARAIILVHLFGLQKRAKKAVGIYKFLQSLRLTEVLPESVEYVNAIFSDYLNNNSKRDQLTEVLLKLDLSSDQCNSLVDKLSADLETATTEYDSGSKEDSILQDISVTDDFMVIDRNPTNCTRLEDVQIIPEVKEIEAKENKRSTEIIPNLEVINQSEMNINEVEETEADNDECDIEMEEEVLQSVQLQKLPELEPIEQKSVSRSSVKRKSVSKSPNKQISESESPQKRKSVSKSPNKQFSESESPQKRKSVSKSPQAQKSQKNKKSKTSHKRVSISAKSPIVQMNVTPPLKMRSSKREKRT